MFKKSTLICLICLILPITSIANTIHHKHYKHHAKHTHKKSHRVLATKAALPITALAVADHGIASNNADIQRFERQYLSLLQRWRIPGSSVAVMKNGQLLYAQGFGYADLGTHQNVTPNSLFRIASISKAITAIATLQLVESHQISLDSKVFNILSELTPFSGMNRNPNINKITVRHLLTMSSGLDHGVNSGSYDPMFGPWPKSVAYRVGETPAACEDMVALRMGTRLAFRPGTQYAYSNLTYCTLGLVIDKVVGDNYNPQTYFNYVHAHILRPLGITDMQLAHTTYSERHPNEVHYYPYFTQTGKRLALSDLPYSNTHLLEHNYADGGWIATATDLVKIGDAVANYKLLSRSSVETMLSPPEYLQYSQHDSNHYFGMGWSVKWINQLFTWEKTGSFTGTNGFLLHTANGYTYAVLFNTRPDMVKRFHQQIKQLLFRTEFENA